MNLEEKIKSLIEELNYHTRLYDDGESDWSDKEWDDKYFELMELEKESGIYHSHSPTQSIQYNVVSELEKVSHNHKMGSLDKTKDWNEFKKYFDKKDVITMLKMDGLTCSLKYENGYLVSAETRGNGVIGENIYHNAIVIPSIPNRIDYREELIIDGEIICTYKDFEKFSNEYANPRNFAAGSIRLLNSKECANRKLTFIAWNIVKGFEETNSFLDKLKRIDRLGFIIVPWVSNCDLDAHDFLIERAKELRYPIDGLVGRFDDIEYGDSLGETEHHSKSAYAYKFYDEEYETSLRDIEWSMGRTGILTPVAIFEPIEMDDSVVERASLHNVSIMKDILGEHPWRGQKIKVYKANAIIPQISSAKLDNLNNNEKLYLPTVCPICGQKLSFNTLITGTEILECTNSDCEGKLINALDHFAGKKGLDIKGLSKATLEKLINWEWIAEVKDLYNLKSYREEWINKAGFGIKSVDNILNAIEDSRNCELSSFITALGIPLIGSTYAKEICKKEEDWNAFILDINNNYDFSRWDGFGDEMRYSLIHYNYSKANELAEMLNIHNSLYGKSAQASTLNGINVCITGKLVIFKNRAELQTKIEESGGKVVSSISKNTNYLINNDSSSSSAKNISAQKLNIPIIAEEEFVKKFF